MENVSRDDWIVGGLALLLAIFLFSVPWFDLSVNIGSITVGGTATDSPDGWAGVFGALAALAVLADLAVERFSPQTEVPEIGGSREGTRLVLASIAVAFVALKFLLHIEFDLFGWGFYVTVICAGALLYFARLASIEASTQPSPSRTRSGSSGGPPSAPPPSGP